MDFNTYRNLVKSNRTVRRFRENEAVAAETLESLVELTRYCASGRNAQPLKYVIVTAAEERARLFPLLKWAGYFSDWDGPEPGERPAAYLIQCLDTKYGNDCMCDDGLQLETITLGMRTLGLAGCIIKAFSPSGVAGTLGIDVRFRPRYVLAIGFPAEEVMIEDMDGSDDADFKYFRTADGIHHVPKRPIEELIVGRH